MNALKRLAGFGQNRGILKGCLEHTFEPFCMSKRWISRPLRIVPIAISCNDDDRTPSFLRMLAKCLERKRVREFRLLRSPVKGNVTFEIPTKDCRRRHRINLKYNRVNGRQIRVELL